ncbi:MAG: metallophosphoesterase [Smithella sp.]
MVMFLLTFLLLYSGIHLYALIRMDSIFHFSAGYKTLLIILMILLIFAPLVVRIAENHQMEALARVVAFIGYLWMAFIFLFFCLGVVFDVARFPFRFFPAAVDPVPLSNIAFVLAVILSFILVAYGYFDAQRIRIKKLEIVTGQNLPNNGKIRIVQISDVHVGIIIKEKQLQVLVDKINAANPDILVSTGDLLDGELNDVLPLTELLAQIKPRFGKYAVTGNHEFYAGIAKSLEFTRQAGFEILRDEVKEVAGINIVGIDDVTGRRPIVIRENPRSTKTMPTAASNDKFVLLLKHQPVVNAADNFNLQLSGHTHGGQIFPFRLITGLFFENNYGYFELEKNKLLYVSRGVGTWGPPVRIFAPPEITIIDLIGQKAN